MNSFPEDDHSLTDFLRQNRPSVPPAAANLEEQLLAAVEITPQEVAIAEPPRRVSQRRLMGWFVPSAIAAGLVATVISYRSVIPSPPNEAELAELQAFIESTWDGTVNEVPNPTVEELYPLTDEASLN